MSAREKVLLRGLIDWVALERVHSIVAKENQNQPLATIQDRVLDLVRSLVTDGLFEIGGLSTSNGRFRAWDTPLEESIERVRDVYTSKVDDDTAWWFYCWLNATEEGLKAAEAIEASLNSV
jgi:hypothetical protein